MKILIVEDNPDMLRIFREGLADYDITFAECRNDAAALLKDGQMFDLRFVDLQIPWEAGRLATRKQGEIVMGWFKALDGTTICISGNPSWARETVKAGLVDKACAKNLHRIIQEIKAHETRTNH